MKKAKQNLFVDGVEYKAGHLYSPESVAHIDASDFEDVEAQESEIIEAGTEGAEEVETATDETQSQEENAEVNDEVANVGEEVEAGTEGAEETLE